MTGAMFNNNGWLYSQMNYDMLSTNPWNSMNLHINQMMDHSAVLMNAFAYPAYNFSNFNQYPGLNFNMGFDTFGSPSWMNGGMNSFGTPNWMNGYGNSFGFPAFGGHSAVGSSDSTCSDPEQEKFRLKYKKLEALAKALTESDILSDDDKSDLKVAMKNTRGTWEERFYNLHEIYDDLDDETVKIFLRENGKKIGVSKDIGGQESNKDSFYNRLLKAGFEYENTSTDTLVTDFRKYVDEQIKENNGNSTSAKGILDIVNGQGDTLDFISSWNSRYSSKSNPKRITKYIAEQWNKPKTDELKDNYRSSIVVPLVQGLIDEANKVQSSLDTRAKEKMNKAVDKLSKELEKSKLSMTSGLHEAFDTVYLMTRFASMQKIRDDAAKYYADIDEEVFDSNLFKDDVLEDLTNEGFTPSQINNLNVTVSDDGTQDTNPEESTETKSDIIGFAEGVAYRLNGTTSKSEIEWINSRIDDLDKNNILTFLDAFYAKEGYGGEGLIEALDDDDAAGKDGNKTIRNSSKINILKYALEKAKAMGLQENEHYKKLNNYIREFEKSNRDEYSGLGDYRESWYNDIEYSDVFDDELEALHKVMKNK